MLTATAATTDLIFQTRFVHILNLYKKVYILNLENRMPFVKCFPSFKANDRFNIKLTVIRCFRLIRLCKNRIFDRFIDVPNDIFDFEDNGVSVRVNAPEIDD